MKTIEECSKKTINALCRVNEVDYQPGNGTRYHLYYGALPDMGEQVDGYFFCSWMRRGGSGGETIRCAVGGFVHWTYMQEKMALFSSEDAKAIAHFVNSVNNPEYSPVDDDLPKGIKEGT